LKTCKSIFQYSFRYRESQLVLVKTVLMISQCFQHRHFFCDAPWGQHNAAKNHLETIKIPRSNPIGILNRSEPTNSGFTFRSSEANPSRTANLLRGAYANVLVPLVLADEHVHPPRTLRSFPFVVGRPLRLPCALDGRRIPRPYEFHRSVREWQ